MTSLRTKFLWGTVLVIVLVMSAVFAVVEHRRGRHIDGEGAAGARAIWPPWPRPPPPLQFHRPPSRTWPIAREIDVIYALSRRGGTSRRTVAVRKRWDVRSAARSTDRAGRRPIVRMPANRRVVKPCTAFAVPVIVDNHRWGTVRVGLSKRRMDAEIQRTRLELGADRHHCRSGWRPSSPTDHTPGQRLADGVAAISRGDWTTGSSPPPWTRRASRGGLQPWPLSSGSSVTPGGRARRLRQRFESQPISRATRTTSWPVSETGS
jgi:hypothetical protein